MRSSLILAALLVSHVTQVALGGEPVDLLALIDLDKHVVHGDWVRDNGGLTVRGLKRGMIQFPAPVPKEYQLLVEVERLAGNHLMGFNLVTGKTRVTVMIDMAHGKTTSLSRVGGKLYGPDLARHDGRAADGGKTAYVCQHGAARAHYGNV